MMVFLWLAAFEEQTVIAGYSLGEMLIYTVGVMVLRTVITSHIEHGMDYEIRQGILSTYLVKPINVWAFYYVAEYAWKIVRGMLLAPVLIVCLVWLAPIMRESAPPIERVPLVLLSVALGYQVCFLMKLCLGTVNFWTNDIAGLGDPVRGRGGRPGRRARSAGVPARTGPDRRHAASDPGHLQRAARHPDRQGHRW